MPALDGLRDAELAYPDGAPQPDAADGEPSNMLSVDSMRATQLVWATDRLWTCARRVASPNITLLIFTQGLCWHTVRRSLLLKPPEASSTIADWDGTIELNTRKLEMAAMRRCKHVRQCGWEGCGGGRWILCIQPFFLSGRASRQSRYGRVGARINIPCLDSKPETLALS